VRVGILSSLHCPFLGYAIEALHDLGIDATAVLLDSKDYGAEARRIHEERTGGRMPRRDLDSFEDQRIPFYFVAHHASTATAGLVQQLEIDILINANTPRILKRDILAAPKVGVVSCHPGLLPQFRGCTCVEWAIYLNEQVGNTAFFMNEGIDEGPVILKEALTFSKSDAYEDVRTHVYKSGLRLMAQAVERVAREGLAPDGLEQQTDGRYFNVIEDDKLREVIQKLEKGAYAFQL